MRMTHEADYAVRIVYVLMQENRMMSARVISEHTGVTLRFALKILRKLAAEGIVVAAKGAAGGYKLAVLPEALPLGRVIECIDGPFELAHCMQETFDCTRIGDKDKCVFHAFYQDVSLRLRDTFYQVHLSDFGQKNGQKASGINAHGKNRQGGL